MPSTLVRDRGQFQGLVASWLLALESERRSPKTRESYETSTHQLATWLADNGGTDDVRELTTGHLRGWLAELAATRSDETCRTRYVGVGQFLRWCVSEGELDASPMANIGIPKVVPKPVTMLTADQLRALVRDCAGADFLSLRDHAMVLMFMDTGVRLSGLLGLDVDDVDLRERSARVRLKGGRVISVPIGATTARAVDKYLRARRRQPLGEHRALWLSGTHAGRLTQRGAQRMLAKRSARVGVHLHPHMFRHGFAHTWLSSGGSESDLMELMGWRSRQMLARYGSALAAERAREAHRRLSPADNL